jgi:hypothetical protein
MLTERNAAIPARNVPAALKISAASVPEFHSSSNLGVDL